MSVYLPNSLYSLIDQGIVEMDTSAEVADDVLFCHTNASGHAAIHIGKNCRIASRAILYDGAVIEDNAQIGHQTIIEANAHVGRNTSIGSGCLIGQGVQLGEDNRVEHHVVIDGKAVIGDRNWIASFVSIGTPPQHPRIRTAHQPVHIGSDNVLREYVTVHSSAEDRTDVGNHCFIMAYTCINHDVVVEDYVTIANNCQIAGYGLIKHHANLGMSCAIHQHSVIGAGVMLGMGSIVAKDIPPFVTFYAGQIHKLNVIGMQRIGYSQSEIDELTDWYSADTSQSLSQRLDDAQSYWWYEDLKRFLEKSQRNVSSLELLSLARH